MTKRRRLPLIEIIFGFLFIILLGLGLGALIRILIRIEKAYFQGNLRYIIFPVSLFL